MGRVLSVRGGVFLREVQEVGSGYDSDFVERGTLLGDMQEKLAFRAGKAAPGSGLGGAR